jgi:hypothetical protein
MFLGAALGTREHQIVGWLSLSHPETTDWDARFAILPVILDSGNSSGLLITQQHLRQWAGLNYNDLPRLGTARLNKSKEEVVTRAARIWLHRNRPDSKEPADILPFSIELENGIIVCKGDEPYAPRLPTLGLKAIVENRLCISINGQKRLCWLNTSWWLFDWHRP